jgi:hypothetical protein
VPGVLAGQTAPDANSAALSQILERLAKLEKQNEQLSEEIRSLRSELAATAKMPASSASPPVTAPGSSSPTLEDRVAVAEGRVEEQAQTKVEASQRFPISLTGIVLFNAFLNDKSGYESSSYTTLLSGPDRTGATLGQTLLGFEFHGPELPWGGRVSGSLDMDFLGGAAQDDYSLQIRRGVLNLDWADRSVSVGQDRPLISQRQPDSLAEVAYPPLADAGDPWLWQPEVRYVERIHLGDESGIDAGASVLETDETNSYIPGPPYYSLDPSRPAFEGRMNFWHNYGNNRRFEIAPGFHTSTTHLNGQSIPSRFATLDWLVKPAPWVRITGLIFGGQNMASLGGFTEGFTLFQDGAVKPVHGFAGWTQFAFPLTSRLTLHVFGGLQAPKIADLGYDSLTYKNSYASNLTYRIAPNVLIGAEALQERAGYAEEAHVIRNHYDLAVGYLF